MIRSVSKTVFVRAGKTATIVAELIPRVDTIGNFSLETASPGGWWGTAVMQLPKETPVPKSMQTASFAGVCHTAVPRKEVVFKCQYDTWMRVVQYLPKYQPTSVSARIEIDTTLAEKFKQFWRKKKIEQPQER